MTSEINSNKAATIIQSAFRGHRARVKYSLMKAEFAAKIAPSVAAAAAALSPLPSFRPKREFSITHLTKKEEFSRLIPVLTEWLTNLEKKWEIAPFQGNWSRNPLKQRWESKPEKPIILQDARFYAEQLLYCLSLSLNPPIQVLVCNDTSDDKTQGLALFVENKNEFIIGHLLTHPDNLRYGGKQLIEKRVEGVGTKLVLSLLQKAAQARLDVTVKAGNASLLFWDKFDFNIMKVDPALEIELQKSAMTAMELSLLKIGSVLSRFEEEQGSAQRSKT